MRLPKFEYLSPRTVEEACGLLAQHGDKAKVLAGGTDYFDPRQQAGNPYGYGRLPAVVTSLEFERIVSGSGPTTGRLVRPHDGRPIRKRRYAFSESFAAIAYGEYAKATGSSEYADKARRAFQGFIDQNLDPKGTPRT